MWNLHICFLLLMLSRVSSSPFTESSPNVRALRFEQQQQQEELGEDPPLYVEDDQEGSLEEHHYFQRESELTDVLLHGCELIRADFSSGWSD